MIVYDTEDNSPEVLASGRSGFEKKVTHIAAICDNGKRFHNTGNPLPFLKWCHAQGKHDIWAFNAQYDIGNLCNTRKLKIDDFNVTLVKGRFIKGTTQGVNFFDVHNLSGGGSSVATLGLAVDLPKFGHPYTPKEIEKFSIPRQKEFFDFLGTTKEKYLFIYSHQSEIEWLKWIYSLTPDKLNNAKYFFRDCEIPIKFLKFVLEKCNELGIQKIPATLGALCVKTFYAKGGENWHEASDISQSALRGARVELFNGGGKGRIAYADINSLYPWCMTQNFPVCMEKLDDLEGYGIAECDIEVPKMHVAPLPWRDPEGRLVFPVGKLSGVWTIHEIKNALAVGCKLKTVKWILGSKEGKPYYRDYIVDKYQRRLDCASEAESLFWKLLMNNLYGRLAISGEISSSLNLTEENLNTDGWVPYGRKILGTYKMPLPEFSNYLHAAYVLSYGRIKLYSYLTAVPWENLIYCDTDSVIFFCEDDLPFPVSKDLGAMKLEAWGSEMIPILPKTYVFDKKYKAKGVPKKQAQAFIETGIAHYDSPFKMRESIRFFDAGNSRKLSVWRQVEKIRKSEYDRKKVSGRYYLPKTVKLW